VSSEIVFSSAAELASRVRSRELSPVEIMKAHLDRVQALDSKLNAIVTTADNALEAAKAAEQAVMRGDTLGPLQGVPFTAKDSIDTAGVLTQRGSPIFAGRVPDMDATSDARPQESRRNSSGEDKPARILLLDRNR